LPGLALLEHVVDPVDAWGYVRTSGSRGVETELGALSLLDEQMG
jgi:hypothetical protein